MSGGSLDYFYMRMDEVIERIESRAKRPIHKAFVLHLKHVQKALHDLEWEWSGDYGEEQADKAINKLVSKTDLLFTVKQDIEKAMTEAKKLLEELK